MDICLAIFIAFVIVCIVMAIILLCPQKENLASGHGSSISEAKEHKRQSMNVQNAGDMMPVSKVVKKKVRSSKALMSIKNQGPIY